MATIHEATLVPTKLKLLTAWLPTCAWCPGAPADLRRVAAARFDDPAGDVGVEIFVVRDGVHGPMMQVPLTYRAAPREGAEAWLIGTTEHSVLGRRWVYDGCGDPVYVAEVIRAIRTGGHEVAEYVQTPAGSVRRDPLMSVRGSGTQAPGSTAQIVRVDDGDPSTVLTDVGELSVHRLLDETRADNGLTLTATWPAHPDPIVLAVLS